MQIDHVGYAVYDIEESIKTFMHLGYVTDSPIYDDEERNVRIVFMKIGNTGDGRVELIAPLAPNSPVDSTLAKSGVSPYHICYQTNDINVAISELKAQGFVVIKKKKPAVAFDGKCVAFLFKKEAGMIELVEN